MLFWDRNNGNVHANKVRHNAILGQKQWECPCEQNKT